MRTKLLLIALLFCCSSALSAPLSVGKIPKAKSAAVLIDSVIYESSAGLIGIGTTQPRGALDVDGFIYGNGSQLTGIVGTGSGTVTGVQIYVDPGMTVSSDETTTNAIFRLAVDPSVYAPVSTLSSYVPTSRTVNGSALSSNVTITTISGNAGTATALASNPTNCSSGNYPLGIDASGNVENCTAVPVGEGTTHITSDFTVDGAVLAGSIESDGSIYTATKFSAFGKAQRTLATRTVCANTTPDKLNCDYVCDGTGDQTEINNAILSLPTSQRSEGVTAYSGLVALSTGTFNLSGAIVIPNPEFIQIQGEGGDNTTLYLSNNANSNMIQTNIASHPGTAYNLVMTDLMLSGNKEGNASGGYGFYDGVGASHLDDSVFDRVFIYNTKNDGFKVNNAYTLKFHNSISEASGAKGIVVLNGADVSIDNSKIIQNLDDSIYVAAGNGVRVMNNYIDISGNGKKGVDYRGDYGIVSNNFITDNSTLTSGAATGVYLAGDKNVMSGNVVVASTAYLTKGYDVVSGADNNNGSANQSWLVSGVNFANAGTNNRIQVDEVIYGNIRFDPMASGAVRLGDATNNAAFDVDGDLAFSGTSDYLVGGNDYAFRYSGDEDGGMYFNGGGNGSVDIRGLDGVQKFMFDLTGEFKFLGVSGDGTGKALCVKSDGNVGTCTNAVGASGTCTCS
jgi:hypothetical protein